jgi:nucleotide-binding universal stress UspA family protein
MRIAERTKTSGFKSILCAVDFSLQSYAALQTAVQILQRRGGHLTVLCVEDPLIDAGAAASGYDTSLIRKSTLAQLDRLMERMATPVGLDRNAWTVETLLGRPAPTIIAFARTISADLIVMGTNGRTGPAKLFFGSVADAVLRRAPAPLLIVARRKPKHVEQTAQAREVVGAIDFGPNDRADARMMAQAAEMMGGRLTLVHVVYPAAGPAFSASLDAYSKRQLATSRKRLQTIAKTVRAKSRVVLGRPEDGIATAASEVKAGLIILALRRGRGIFGQRQGATTYRVLCTSTIPVLALPPT